MTQRVRQLTDRLSRLPRAMQDRWASRFLARLEKELGSAASSEEEDLDDVEASDQWVGGRRPTPEEVRQVFRELADLRKRQKLGGLSIRDMIEEGRR